jgi:hypothetical protein
VHIGHSEASRTHFVFAFRPIPRTQSVRS